MIMKYMEMLKGARNIVTTCANVQQGEDVLIVTDTTKVSLAEVLAVAAQERKAEVTIAIMGVRKLGQEPPKPVISAMMAADVIITPTEVTMYHTKARMEACDKGARILTLTGATEELLMRESVMIDFQKQKAGVERIGEEFTKARKIKFTTSAGTDLDADIEGRKANVDTGICHKPGECVGIPLVEVNVPPLENTAEGVIVADGSASLLGIIKEPIKITVKKGKAVEITGGDQAEQLKEILEEKGDPNVYTIAEIAVGLNPKSKIIGILTEDESAWRTGHIALGDNTGLGGISQAPLHIDMIIKKPTIVLEDEFVVVRDGIPQVGFY
jgi:leucyl aminopeptidase (aminopeptidase T)